MSDSPRALLLGEIAVSTKLTYLALSKDTLTAKPSCASVKVMGSRPITATRSSGREVAWGVSLSATVHGLAFGVAIATSPCGKAPQAAARITETRNPVVVILPFTTSSAIIREAATKGAPLPPAAPAPMRRTAPRSISQRISQRVGQRAVAPAASTVVSDDSPARSIASAAPAAASAATAAGDIEGPTSVASGGNGVGGGAGEGQGNGFPAGCCNGADTGEGQSGNHLSTSVKSAARPLVSPRPPYPREARLSGWEGTVVLQLLIDVDGYVTQVTVATSSGHALLDQSAVTTARKWRFAPAIDAGRPTAKVHEIRFRFRLDDRLG